jgi:hypothetical protein
VLVTVSGEVETRSRPGAIAPTTYGVRPVSASSARVVPGLMSPTFSSGSSTASKPSAAMCRRRSGRFASVSGEVHTHVLTPMALTTRPFLEKLPVVVSRLGRGRPRTSTTGVAAG